MKKIPKIIIIIIIAALYGFINSMLIHNGYSNQLKTGLKNISWYFYILIILINFFLIILIHELGHLFAFVFQKIKIKALLVLVFVLVKKEKWQIKVKMKNIKLIGGLVVPILPKVKTEEEYLILKNKFKKALILGPITSIAYFGLIFILFVVLWFFTKSTTFLAITYISFIVTTLMTILIHFSSKINTNHIYGDYIAYSKFDEEKFSLVQIVQYTNFDYEDDKENELFLFNKINDFYKINNPTYNLFDLALCSYYITYFLSLNILPTNELEKTVSYFRINSLKSKEEGLELAYLIASYYYQTNNIGKAYQILNDLNANIKNVDESKQKILKLQYEHYLNLKDNKEELIRSKVLIIKQFDILEPIFDIDKHMNSLINTLPFKKYKTKFICYLN